jgi:hypothetical protein
MIRFLAEVWAKWTYVARKYSEAHIHELSARVADSQAALTRQQILKLTKEAEDMDAD